MNSPSMTPGHRVMTPEQIALIEKVRALGIAIESVINETKAANTKSRNTLEGFRRAANGSCDDATVRMMTAQAVVLENRFNAAEPERWLAMARTDLQCGLMKLTRAVAQPEFF